MSEVMNNPAFCIGIGVLVAVEYVILAVCQLGWANEMIRRLKRLLGIEVDE